jgi:hypothetical protein
MSKSRLLFFILCFSGALNVALLSILFYFLIQTPPHSFFYHPPMAIAEGPPPCEELFAKLENLTFTELTALLSDQRKVAHGYLVRDFALGALAKVHDFDVERGLSRGELSTRMWQYQGNTFLLFPGLGPIDFEKLQAFAQEDKWPFTPRGLLRCIKEEKIENCDPALISFFCHTPHFLLIETLFARTGLPIQKRSILTLIMESEWGTIENFYQQQKKEADFSIQKRRDFLLAALRTNSRTAAQLLLLTDLEFAVNDIDDQLVLKIFELQLGESQAALSFAYSIAESPRSDPIQQKALAYIATYSGSSPQDELVGHFLTKPGLKELRPVFREAPPAAPDPRTHVVQPGESLWQISKKYHVPLEILIKTNHLESTTIQAGKCLKIPP